jgi:two-component system, OmpR family, sensor histidine kinase KdpD
MSTRGSDGWRLAAALAAIGAVTLVLGTVLGTTNASTVSTTYLLVVPLVAATSRLRVAVITSVTAMLCLNFFFLPPIGTFTISDPQNWIALVAFIAVSLMASRLTAVAQARTDEALSRRDELTRLFDLSRDVLLITDSREALSVLARSIARRFDLEFVAVALPRAGEWEIHQAGGEPVALDPRQLSSAYAAAQTSLEFDAYARTYAGHRTISANGREIRLVPLRIGTRPIGVLAAAGRPVEAGTLDTLAGVVAIAVERAYFLEQLKTTLLASLSHDLRTPLTAISVAASNLKGPELTRRRASGAERPDPVRGGAIDAAVRERPRYGPHRRGRRRPGLALDPSFGDRRHRARAGGARAAGPSG